LMNISTSSLVHKMSRTATVQNEVITVVSARDRNAHLMTFHRETTHRSVSVDREKGRG